MPFKKRAMTPEQAEEIRIQEFFDRVVPGTVRFFTDHFICGNSYKCVWAVREWPPTTEEQAILAHLADRSSVTLRIYNRLVDSAEQRQIIQHAARRNKLMSTVNDVTESIAAESNLQDVVQLIADMRRNKEPLLHCAVFIELKAVSEDKLKELQSDILMELTRSKITVDRLILRQKEGMLSALPFGYNVFGSLYERVLPASSVANLYPLNYSGKTDEKGFYIGKCKVDSCTRQRWLCEEDGMLRALLFSACGLRAGVGADLAWPAEGGLDDAVELLVPVPFDALYPHYLCAKLDAALGETERYAGEQARYNSILAELSAWLRRRAKPKRGAQWRW